MSDKQVVEEEVVQAIALGNRVRDKVSGFTGITTSRVMKLGAATAFGIQPSLDKDKPGKYPHAVSVDETQLEFIDAGVRDRVIEPGPVTIKLGDEVVDEISGYRGFVLSLVEHLNGCTFAVVQGKAKKDGEPPKAAYAEHWAFKKVPKSTGISKLAPKPDSRPAAERSTPVPPGGPVTRARSAERG